MQLMQAQRERREWKRGRVGEWESGRVQEKESVSRRAGELAALYLLGTNTYNNNKNKKSNNNYNKYKSQLQASGRRRRVGSNIKKHRRLPLSLSLPFAAPACCNICFDIAPPVPVSPSPCNATLVQLSVSRSVIQSLCLSIPLLRLPTINFL